ncbi:hypothetical protein Zm00014a_005391 [Zea mays]|uniref:Uncharacterized protein n=1 Tax=Zea mays TaxID=4577 RepID=A0A3L6G0E7_MAIZE|nr:hypothetical protein Zm00014a_005391 [Zea mays]
MPNITFLAAQPYICGIVVTRDVLCYSSPCYTDLRLSSPYTTANY